MLQAKNCDKEESGFKIYEYYSGEDFIAHIKENISYDLLILDMDMEGMDGHEIAKIFRKRFPYSVLVFCSGVRPPTSLSFKSRPFRYLLKSYTDEEFIDEMREILVEVERTHEEPCLLGHYRNITIKVKRKNVIYIQNAKRGSQVIVSPECEEAKIGRVVLIYEKLNELPEKFLGPDFVYAHCSYMVNLNHVERVSRDEILLDNGEILSVSRRYQKTFREAFVKSVRNKY